MSRVPGIPHVGVWEIGEERVRASDLVGKSIEQERDAEVEE